MLNLWYSRDPLGWWASFCDKSCNIESVYKKGNHRSYKHILAIVWIIKIIIFQPVWEMVLLLDKASSLHYWNGFPLRLQYNPWHPPVIPWTYPDIPGLHPDIPWRWPLNARAIPWYPLRYTQSTLITPWNTLRNPCQPRGHPDIPWWSPLMARTTPWHSLTVTWCTLIPTDILWDVKIPFWTKKYLFYH